MLNRCLRSHLSLLPVLALCAGAGWSQSSTGTISGRVVDPTGAVIAGADVSIQNEIQKDTRTFSTLATGEFVFADVQPGRYTLSVKSAGFRPYQASGLVLNASDTLSAGDIKLALGATTDTVEVVASAAAVQTQSGDRTSDIDSKQVMQLMARGRDVMALLQILPGTVNDATGSDVLGQFTTPTMDGTRNNYNALNIDGISGNTARGSNAQSPINMDAIESVKVLANSYTAEFGTAGGGVINLVTKSGTQQFHGGLYYYSRNEDFNANNFFNNRAIPFVQRPRYRYNTEGANIGGPIYWPGHFNRDRQKLFFYFSQEYDPNTTPNSISNFTVPTASERQGIFARTIKDPLNSGTLFPNNTIPSNRIDPNMAKLMAIFPLPNVVGANNCSCNFQIAGSEDQPVKQEMLKIDYIATDKARFWFKASGFSSDNNGLNSPAINNKWGPAPVDYQQTMPFLGANFSYVFSPTLVNELSVGMNLWTEDQLLTSGGLAAYQRATYGIDIKQTYPTDNPDALLPAVSFGNIGNNNAATISYDGRFPMVDDSTLLQLSDSVTKVWNNHTFKAGIFLAHRLYNQYHQAGGNSFGGAFNFTTDSANPNDTGYGYANAMLGYFDTYTEATNRVNYAPITKNAEWFIQDHWKVAPRLSLSLGLRFTDAIPMAANNQNAGNFVPSLYNPAQAPVLYRPAVVSGAKVTINPITGATVLPVYAGLIVPNTGNPMNGLSTPSSPGFPNYSNGVLFAPRLGAAWDPFGDGKTAVRLGGGIYYAGIPDAGTLGNLFFNPPAIYTPTQYYGTVAAAYNGTGLLSPSSFSRDIDQHGKIVTTYHANFEIQRQIDANTLVTVAYVGSFGRHLGEKLSDINTVPYGAEFLPQNQNPQTNTPLNDNYFRPYQGYSTIPMQIWEGNSSYHSLQITARRTYHKGLQYGASYTFSKAMDYSEGDSTTSGGVAQFIDRRIWNYGLAGYDRPNILTFYYLWDVPRLSRLMPNPVVKALFDGWQLSGITSFVSGQYLAVSMSTSPSVNFVGGGDGSRPLMVASPTLPNDQRTVNTWFNTAAFKEPTAIAPSSCTTAGCPALTIANIGDMPATSLRGPGVNNWNASVFKNFQVKERLNFQLRMETYNTFNHTQFSGVGTSVQYDATGANKTAAFGTITSARDPRYLQLALSAIF